MHFSRPILALAIALGWAGPFSLRAADYHPRFWVEGVADRVVDTAANPDTALDQLTGELARKGWGGIVYWGADRKGARMDYYFRSAALAGQEWASPRRDGLTPLVKAAGHHGLKVMVNIEGVNPYHRKKRPRITRPSNECCTNTT